MTSRIRRLARLFYCLLMFGMAAYAAEPAKTVVSDTIYRADGSPASGTMVISWPAFVSADGKPVAAGSKTVKIGADGAVSIPLVPTQGATPSGTYYKVVLSLDDGVSSQEYWTVPTLSPTSIAAIRSAVVPATVAMQVVSREYVDGALANTVHKTGDETVDGVKTFDSSPLVPSPSAPTAAANKDYVDVSVAAGSGSSTLGLNKGGTGQTTWTPARCVRVANNGSKLESAPVDCGIATNSDMVDGMHASAFQSAMANAATLSKIAESGGNPLWNGSAWPGGYASNSDMVDGQHASAFQSAMTNAATLSKIAESGGNPLWNGSPWPGGGGSGNATQIQGKAVDVPDTARQFEVYDGATAFKKWQDPVVRMNRDCGIVGTGDETAALNTCIANLTNYTGVLQCDKPGMVIHSTGVVVRDKVGIRIETAGGGHSLNNYCQLIYTGSAAGTLIDVERTRNSVLFKGFQIYAGDADIGFQTGQTGSGSNIATSDSFEEIVLNNNNGRSTFIGFMIGDGTANNSDEMKFNHVSVSSSVCTKCGTAFKSVTTNVYGAEFRDIMLSNMGVGWDWTNNASVDKVNATSVALLYKLQGNSRTFHVQHEDVEWADQILQSSNGSVTLVEENGRVILNSPANGGLAGTSGHPAWDNSSGGSLKVRNVDTGVGAYPGLTLLKGGSASWADVDFYDPGITTYGAGIGGAGSNALNFLNNNAFLSGVAGSNSTIWVGRGFLDEKRMMVPGIGMQQTNSGSGLRGDFTPCTRGNVCLNEGQVELTGVHSIFNTPTISYTGTAGSTARYYAVVACDDTSCAAGHRSIPTTSVHVNNTLAALDGSDYVTLTWTPALNVNKYGILQQQNGSPNNWNLVMSNLSCSTNPCTANITTDSSTYTSGYPSDNETGGVILRGAIKMGKSSTQTAALDLTYATVTPPSGTITGLDADKVDGKHAADFLAATTQLAATKTCTGTDKVSAYDASTGTFTCTADQTGSGGSGITSLNGATVTTQTFVNGANISVSTNTGTGAHTVAVTGLGGAAALNVGTTTGTVAAGDDSRMTNARTPTAHASTHVTGGTDVIPNAVAAGNAGLMTGADKTKLDGIAADAARSVTADGAVCNGSTDDTTAIQATITAARVVTFPQGATCVVDTLSITSAKTLIGYGATLKEKLNSAQAQMILSNSSGLTQIIGLTIDGNKANQNALPDGIRTLGTGDVLIKDITMTNVTGRGILSQNSGQTTIVTSRILNNAWYPIYATAGYLVVQNSRIIFLSSDTPHDTSTRAIYTTVNALVEGNFIDTGNKYRDGIWFTNGAGGMVKGNTVQNTTDDSVSVQTATGLTITGNNLFNSSTTGCVLMAGTDSFITVTGNYCTGDGNGAIYILTNDASDITITGNVINQTDTYPGVLVAAAFAPTRLTISGNIISAHTAYAINTGKATDVQVTGNIFSNCAGGMQVPSGGAARINYTNNDDYNCSGLPDLANATAVFAQNNGKNPGIITPAIVGSGSITSLLAPSGFVICTTTCSVTIPAPAAGNQFCVRNAPGSATVITLAALGSSKYYELTGHSAWATANQKLVSGGVATDAICVVGYDANHYMTYTSTGTWTDTP